jgi:hypothetical protein
VSGTDSAGPSPRPLTGEQQLRKDCGFSQVLVDDLKAHRLQIAKAHLAGDFGVAFDLALYSLCTDLRDRGWRSRPLDLRAVETRPSSSLDDLTGTPADRLLEAHEKALDLDWLSLPGTQGFEALAALPAEAKQNLFAWCVAAVVNTQLAIEDHDDPVIESAIRRLAIPFADFWRPTVANYWGRVKKAHGLGVAESILGRAGCATTPTTRRPPLPRRWNRPSTPKPPLPASVSTRPRETPPGCGCRRVSPPAATRCRAAATMRGPMAIPSLCTANSLTSTRRSPLSPPS